MSDDSEKTTVLDVKGRGWALKFKLPIIEIIAAVAAICALGSQTL